MKNRTNYTIEFHMHLAEGEVRKRVKNKRTGKPEMKTVRIDPKTAKAFKVVSVTHPRGNSPMPGTWLTKDQVLTMANVAEVTVKTTESERRY